MSSFNLYGREATVTIAGKKFVHSKKRGAPKFSIEFELEQALSSFTKTNVRLYNPNDDTISKCESKVEGGKTTYPTCVVEAGYAGHGCPSAARATDGGSAAVNNFGVCAEGVVKKYDVYRQGTDRILDCQIFDNGRWWDVVVNKSFREMKASEIIAEITAGYPTSINLGEDVFIKRLVVLDIYSAIVALKKATRSRFSFRNGMLVMEPAGYRDERAYLLDYGSGLLEVPEKIDRPARGKEAAFHGYKIKTFFLYGLHLFRSVHVKTSKVEFKGVITNVKQEFSTFDDKVSEYEVAL